MQNLTVFKGSRCPYYNSNVNSGTEVYEANFYIVVDYTNDNWGIQELSFFFVLLEITSSCGLPYNGSKYNLMILVTDELNKRADF